MRRALTALILIGFRSSAQPSGAAVPDNLKPPAGEKLAHEAHAEGDQVYSCDGSAWMLTGPDAKLVDQAGKQVGSHYSGPTWEWFDGSRVIGRPSANATPDPDSIPWLLLTAADHQGSGAMSRISSIQRLFTKGGKAPANGCDAAHKGEKTRAHYTATYRFFTPAE